MGPKKYEIIAGERRFRACRLIGLSKIPAIVKSSDETASMIGSFLENAQREDLSPAEKENALIALWRTGRFNASKDLEDRKSTRLNSSHDQISYAVFCLKKKKRADSMRAISIVACYVHDSAR